MRRTVVCVLALLSALLGVTLVPSVTVAATQPGGALVSEVPANGTPHVLDGRVLSIVEVGNSIVLGGTFTRAQNHNDTTELTRTGLLAFDKTTRQISTTFVPETNGFVNVVLPHTDGETVYVGGSFTTIGGVARKNLARVRVSDGAVLTAFDAGNVAGEVRDLRLSNGRLWVAGAFTHIANRARPALATLWPASGAYMPYFELPIAGTHNGGFTTVIKIDLTPSGDRLMGIGNFTTLNGVANNQIFMLDTSGAAATAAAWQTTYYTSTCSDSFDSYVRDLDFSPDGSFVVIATTGAYRGTTTSCDTTARFETYATGTVAPSWVDYTGGDTTHAVLVTDAVVYTGGHARWQNNPFNGDEAGPGAVAREGIAALDPANGLPLSWNPGRDRGVGVFDFLYSEQGLWVGSDTERIGADFLRQRIALLPLAGGASFPSVTTPSLPNDVYVGYPLGSTPPPVASRRINAGGPAITAAPVNWEADASGNGYHNSGLRRNSYTAVGSLDASVPAGTPSTIFSTELVAPGGLLFPVNNINFNIPVPSGGVPLEVRLYFANRSTSTDGVGQRRFHVDVEGTRVLSNFDIVAAVGHNRGMMRSFQVTGDGNLDLDLTRGSNSYPLINGIEILSSPATPPPANPLLKRDFTGTNVNSEVVAPAGGLDWNTIRGAFMTNGFLYLAHSDGTFTKRSFDGTTYGSPQAVNTHDLLVPLTDWRSDIQSATSMFYDNGRIYFTLSGQSPLYYRYFTAESGVVGAQRFVATTGVAGLDLSQVRGGFVTDDRVYVALATGQLMRLDWAQNAQSGVPVANTAVQVSGPGVDSSLWNSRALFVYQAGGGGPAPQEPTASFTFDCVSLACDFDASSSVSPGSTITSYGWDFGDGSVGSGANASHTYADSGTRTVTLTVTTAQGLQDTEAQSVQATQVNRAPTAAFTSSCNQLACSFDGTASSDPDGDSLTYSWDFGDGSNGSGASPNHSYAAVGTYTVTLSVSDGSLQDGESKDVTASQATIQHVAATSTAGNRTAHAVTIPASVQAGDTLLLFLTTNADAAITAPSGWTAVATRDGNAAEGRVWSRTATAADAGSVVTATTAVIVKSVFSVTAYRNPAGSVSVAASAAGGSNTSTQTHTTPQVDVADGGSWLVSYWSEKSADVQTWTTPGSVTVRTQNAAAPAGKVSAVLGDSNGAVGVGPAGGLAATTSTAGNRSITFSVVLGVE